MSLQINNQSNIGCFPKEIVNEFFKFLRIQDLVKIRKVCTSWKTLLDAQICQRILIKKERFQRILSRTSFHLNLFAKTYQKEFMGMLASSVKAPEKEMINSQYENVLNDYSTNKAKGEKFLSKCLQTKDDFLRSVDSFVKASLRKIKLNSDHCYQYQCLFPFHEEIWMTITLGKLGITPQVEKIEICLDKYDDIKTTTLVKDAVIGSIPVKAILSGKMTEFMLSQIKTSFWRPIHKQSFHHRKLAQSAED